MTGFGREKQETSLGQFSIEIKAVNHRYLNLNFKLPHALSYLEPPIQERIKAQVKRGQLYVTLDWLPGETMSNVTVRLDRSLATQYQAALEELRQQLKLHESLRMETFVNLPGVFSLVEQAPEEAALWNALEPGLEVALQKLEVMRSREGAQIQQNLKELLDSIQEHTQQLHQINENQLPALQERLQERLAELLADSGEVDETRVIMEAGLLADRVDVTEELARLESHCQQFEQALYAEEPIGRQLDFLLQEMHREANTIASKNNHRKAASLCVHLKVAIEKMRELVQNVE